MSNNVIAIDGPAASGKSTVARRVAAATGGCYVDSGALYRAVTWQALRKGLNTADPAATVRLAQELPIEFFLVDGAVRFRVDGIEPGRELRTETINQNVSKVAATPGVRQKVGDWLRDMTRFGGLVVEGRDIGTAVFPAARHKFYLDASAEERARRRYAEMVDGKLPLTQKAVDESLKKRDQMDSTRKADPLKTAPDAVVIDSTNMGIDEVAQFIVAQVVKKSN